MARLHRKEAHAFYQALGFEARAPVFTRLLEPSG